MNFAFEDLTLIDLTRLAHAIVRETITVSEQEGQELLESLSMRQAEVKYLEHLKALDETFD